MNDTLENKIQLFIDSAIDHAKFTEEDYKKANKSYDKIIKVIEYLEKEGLTDELDRCLDHEHAAVRVWAASFALKNKKLEHKAIKVLEEVANHDYGIQSFSAKMTLKEWNS